MCCVERCYPATPADAVLKCGKPEPRLGFAWCQRGLISCLKELTLSILIVRSRGAFNSICQESSCGCMSGHDVYIQQDLSTPGSTTLVSTKRIPIKVRAYQSVCCENLNYYIASIFEYQLVWSRDAFYWACNITRSMGVGRAMETYAVQVSNLS